VELLEFSASTERLTQGRPVAEMAFVVQRAGEVGATGRPQQARTSPTAGRPARVDPYAVAQRVYELLRQDLVAFRDRRGPRY